MNYEQAKNRVKELTPMDNNFFQKIAEDIDSVEEIIQVVLQNKTLRIVKVIPQSDIKNLQGRSVILDALCEDSSNKFYNVEVQIADNDNHLRRVRYNASCVTANLTDTGTKFEKVPDLYVIYISAFDMFGSGRTIYHVEPTIQETRQIVDNGLHEIYVNTAVDDGTEIAELMQCFLQPRINNDKFKNLKKRVDYLKGDKEEVLKMAGTMKEIAKEYAKECVMKEKIESVDNLINDYDFSLEDACKVIRITVEQYKAVKEKEAILV